MRRVPIACQGITEFDIIQECENCITRSLSQLANRWDRQSKRRCERLGTLRTHGHLPSEFRGGGTRSGERKAQATVTDNGGKLGEIKEMGKRRLAYEINNLREGIYQVVNFEAENPDVVNELDRVIKIDDRYVRHLIVNMTKDRKE